MRWHKIDGHVYYALETNILVVSGMVCYLQSLYTGQLEKFSQVEDACHRPMRTIPELLLAATNL